MVERGGERVDREERGMGREKRGGEGNIGPREDNGTDRKREMT